MGNPPVTGGFPHTGQWRRSLMFSLICAWTNVWANNRDTGDLRRNRVHYVVTVMIIQIITWTTPVIHTMNAWVVTEWPLYAWINYSHGDIKWWNPFIQDVSQFINIYHTFPCKFWTCDRYVLFVPFKWCFGHSLTSFMLVQGPPYRDMI